MIIYNVTVKIDLEIHDDWVNWMQEKHIPDVMNTGKFLSYKLLKILAENESDGISYCIQYKAESMTDYLDYVNDYSAELQEEHTARYKDKFVAFRTLLKEIY